LTNDFMATPYILFLEYNEQPDLCQAFL